MDLMRGEDCGEPREGRAMRMNFPRELMIYQVVQRHVCPSLGHRLNASPPMATFSHARSRAKRRKRGRLTLSAERAHLLDRSGRFIWREADHLCSEPWHHTMQQQPCGDRARPSEP